MQQRNWIVFRVTLYLGLAIAIFLLGYFIYSNFFEYTDMWRKADFYFFIAGAALQTLFYVLNIGLLHYYLPNRLVPGKPYRVWHSALLIFNSCVAIGSLVVLVFAFSDVFITGTGQPATEDMIAVAIIAGYTFITFYVSSASIVVRRYNTYQAGFVEAAWVSQLGADIPIN